jgi:hypothetical protein
MVLLTLVVISISKLPCPHHVPLIFDANASFSVTLPGLEEVKGGFNMQSTGSLQCSAFDSLRNNNVILGSYTCKQTANPTTINGQSGTSTGSGSASSSSKSSATALREVPIVGLTAIIGSLLQALL